MQKFFTACLASIFIFQTSHASENQKSSIVNRYAEHVFSQYKSSLEEATVMQTAINEFLQNPSRATQVLAQKTWTAARKVYSETEVFRFYSGPIDGVNGDGENGPEGSLNAWPLDEGYIDYVIGRSNSGIINNISEYPVLSADLLRNLNEKNGEKNISTGYHAIEFLLWGQDFNANGPGQRKFTDFVVGQKINQKKNADRRRQYLTLVTNMLIQDLQGLVQDWDLYNQASYGAKFVRPENRKNSLFNLLTGAYTLAAEELSQERMFVAYDTQLQEDEHSCFSDTTHFDIMHNYRGIANVLRLTGVLDLIATKSLPHADKVRSDLEKLDSLVKVFPRPFDQAILKTEDRKILIKFIRSLEDLGEGIQKAAKTIGIVLN